KQYDAALQKWNEDYAIYTILGPAKAAGNGASKDLSALATVVANFDAKIQQSLAQYDGTSIKAIYLAVLDPGIVPVIITNDLGFVNGDKVLASITVTRAAPPSLSIASTALAGTSAAAAPATGSASTLLTANLASQTYTMMARTFWRPVLDYSLGLGWASYGQTNYYLDSTRIVRSGASDSADIGAAALAQLYFTPFMLGDLVGLTAGPCIGVMQANQPNLLLGVSGIISVGSRVRVSASIGDAWGKVTVLNGDKVGSVAQSTTETSPSTASVIQQGTFWSITASYSF